MKIGWFWKKIWNYSKSCRKFWEIFGISGSWLGSGSARELSSSARLEDFWLEKSSARFWLVKYWLGSARNWKFWLGPTPTLEVVSILDFQYLIDRSSNFSCTVAWGGEKIKTEKILSYYTYRAGSKYFLKFTTNNYSWFLLEQKIVFNFFLVRWFCSQYLCTEINIHFVTMVREIPALRLVRSNFYTYHGTNPVPENNPSSDAEYLI